MKKKQKIVVIVGPTASGKSSLAVQVAKQLNGEVISADSRQVYRGLDIGTEKITHEEMEGIPHFLIDIVEPDTIYTAAEFQKDAAETINEIAEHGHVPIIAGGTFFYVDVLLKIRELAAVSPNTEYRAELEKLDTTALFQRLETLDPQRASSIDRHNKRRLIRALEIVREFGSVPRFGVQESPYESLIIGIDVDPDELREKINVRLGETLKKGLDEETKALLGSGISKERLDEIGLEYRVVTRFLEGEITEEEMRTELQNKVWQYARRQMTWLRNRDDIVWFKTDEREKILTTVKQFLN